MQKRKLPFSQKAALILINKKSLSAFLLMTISLFFNFHFYQNIDWKATFMLGEGSKIAKGKITHIFDAITYDESAPLLGYEYVFDSPIGELYWISYGTGYNYEVGKMVNVEYNVKHPDINRIMGMMNSPVDMARGALTLLFLGAFIPLIAGIYSGLKNIKLVCFGEIGFGELIRKQLLKVDSNDNPEYKFTFEFTAKDDKKYTVIIETKDDSSLQDEKQEMLFYDPNTPSKATLVDNLSWPVPSYVKKHWLSSANRSNS